MTHSAIPPSLWQLPAGFDARRTPARADLAASHLKGKIEAARYVEGARMEVLAPALPLKKQPGFDQPLESEAIRGEYFTVYEIGEEGWSWGQLERDHYVGWLPSEMLAKPQLEQTHKVVALRTFAYPGPSIKLPNSGAFSLGSQLSICEIKDGFARSSDGLYFYAEHLRQLDFVEPDFIAVAERFLNAPYLWGGKTSLGLDCSGLVQISRQAAGFFSPRDSDMQGSELGEPLEIIPDFSNLRRGDLLRWKGHCGLMLDAKTLLHANGYHMAVVSEDLLGAVERIKAKSYGDVTGIRRFA